MTWTRTELRTRARIRADQDQSDFPTDVAYNYYLAEAYREVWSDLLGAGWPVNYTSQTVPLTGAAQYAIAAGAGVKSVLGVYWISGTSRFELKRLDQSFKAQVLSAVNNQPLYYELMLDPAAGTVFRFYPLIAAGSVQVDYIPDPVAFVIDSDLWYGPAMSDELLVIRAAVKAVLKEGRTADAGALETEYRRLLEKVTAQASWVDQRNTPVIRDVNRNPTRDPFAYTDAVGPDPGWGY